MFALHPNANRPAMTRRNEPIDYRLLSKVSILYYLRGQTQQEIADAMHLSRPKVSRLLHQARALGVVQISITSNGNFLELETEIETRYGLKEVLIVDGEPVSADDVVLRRKLGTAAAGYLLRTVQEGDVIGVTWGATLQAMVQALQPRAIANVRLVQTLGGLGPPEAEVHAADLSRRFAQLLGGTLTLLPAPGIVATAETRDILLSDPYVRTALNTFSRLTTAYAGIGSLTTNPVFHGKDFIIPPDAYDRLCKAHAAGDIAMRFFDEHGCAVTTPLDDLMIGITLDELRRVPHVVGIAGGREKVQAIRGAVKGKYIDVLITDYPTAKQLI